MKLLIGLVVFFIIFMFMVIFIVSLYRIDATGGDEKRINALMNYKTNSTAPLPKPYNHLRHPAKP
jgi:hypothetical protein